MLLLIGEDMKGLYDSYDLEDGVRHTFSVAKGVKGEKVPSALALSYFNGADDVKVMKVPASNGWEYELDISSSKYDGQLIRGKLLEGYAEETIEVDPREEKILKEKLRYIV